METCATCKSYFPIEEKSYEMIDEDYGECRRFPPVQTDPRIRTGKFVLVLSSCYCGEYLYNMKSHPMDLKGKTSETGN